MTKLALGCTTDCYPWVKRPIHEAEHSPSSSTEVKNEKKKLYFYPPINFMAWCTKCRNNFNLELNIKGFLK
jgi:hypothetical protein